MTKLIDAADAFEAMETARERGDIQKLYIAFMNLIAKEIAEVSTKGRSRIWKSYDKNTLGEELEKLDNDLIEIVLEMIVNTLKDAEYVIDRAYAESRFINLTIRWTNFRQYNEDGKFLPDATTHD